MRRMTCRPRLRQRLRRGENGLIIVAAICLGLMVLSTRGGSLDATWPPTSSNSAMFTLNDIYNKLDTGAAVSRRPGAFTEPGGGPTNGTMHTLNAIMTLVTNRASVTKTGQTTSYVPYDNGWYSTNFGVAWPTQRFTVLGDTNAPVDLLTNCVRDNLTGLIWARNANQWGRVDWGTAVTNCNNLATYGGTNDWRLPNFKELLSLIDFSRSAFLLPTGNPFTGVQSDKYWSSTTFKASAGGAWTVNLGSGQVYPWEDKIGTNYYVWPVRGGK